ncbi:MAG TPA: molybdopterin-binding/glycosyltransferase family 2 protein [Verrucomicrobiae bacterium]|nr:molybdopterin-binding/glycosyltransferase family 2 protein [Verrucomicrobiae bacterium]
MIFAEMPLAEAEGALLAHSVKLKGGAFKKGRRLSAADIAALAAVGQTSVMAVRLEADDVPEDEAARAVAEAVAGDHLAVSAPFTGRANLMASAKGVLVVDQPRLDELNLLDEAITLATLPPFDPLAPGEMAATVKIIPFAVPRALLDRALALAKVGPPLLRLAAIRPRALGLIQTRLSGTKESVLDKTREVTNARLAELGCPPVVESRSEHRIADLTAAIRAMDGPEMLLIAGASAITDRRDVIPAAITACGGEVLHFGMPVDPGNLLLLGRIGERPVLGLPGCARSPKVNGFDWVLRRLMADLPVDGRQIMRMGAGGLLIEIPTRPQPRAEPALSSQAPKVAAIVLAAGRSSRMGGANKLLTEIEGLPMVARAVEAALASKARPVIVVTGHDSVRLRAAIGDRTVTVIENPAFASGMASSLKAGITALPTEIDGALVCLADMPLVGPQTLDRLIAAFNPLEGRAICVPSWDGKRGNPVLWAKRFFPEMASLAGDTGARHLIGQYAELLAEVPMPDDGVLLDIDTPEALMRYRQRPA